MTKLPLLVAADMERGRLRCGLVTPSCPEQLQHGRGIFGRVAEGADVATLSVVRRDFVGLAAAPPQLADTPIGFALIKPGHKA